MDKVDQIKVKDKMYQDIISQLQSDGYMAISKLLIQQVKPNEQHGASEKLFEMFRQSVSEEDKKALTKTETYVPGTGIDMEFDSDTTIISPEAASYETCYVTSHKNACRAAAFSRDGLYIATGSVDTSIKVLDVERMLLKSTLPVDMLGDIQQGDHPVIRTLYDHIEEVTCLNFHPTEQIIVSGSRDYTVKIFDYSKSTAKRSVGCINEVAYVRDLCIHPSGDYVLVGTERPELRMYNFETKQCYVSAVQSDHHTEGINSISFSPYGHKYVTGSRDGVIKIWDGRSCRNVQNFDKAHGGTHVTSVRFSRNGKYVLSSGKDSIPKLWDLNMPGRAIHEYTGAELEGKQLHRTQAVFNHTEDYVLFPNERSIAMCCWSSRSGERKRLLSLGHQGAARRIEHSPTAPAFITCSEDHRARFWYKKQGAD